MHLRCPHCTLIAIGPDEAVDRHPFRTLSKHINAAHRNETFLCQRRHITPPSPLTLTLRNHRDFWMIKRNGDRACSYCGSMHEDDFREILQGFVEEKQGYLFATTDKPDKVYANRPGVRNSPDGGTKFFLQHISDPSGDALHTLGALFEEALKRLQPAAISSE